MRNRGIALYSLFSRHKYIKKPLDTISWLNTTTESTCVFMESGEDPLVDDQNEHDINSAAGVLKLYFRGLENPIFPKEHFLDFISTISESRTTEHIQSSHRGCEGTGQTEKEKTHLATSNKLGSERRSVQHMEAIWTCLIFNRKPVGRGECRPHQFVMSEQLHRIISPTIVIVWCLCSLSGANERQEGASVKVSSDSFQGLDRVLLQHHSFNLINHPS